MDVLLRTPEVLARYPKRKSSFYTDVHGGLFTAPVRLGLRSVAWPSSEVAAIVAARVRGASDQEIRDLVQELHTKRLTAGLEREAA